MFMYKCVIELMTISISLVDINYGGCYGKIIEYDTQTHAHVCAHTHTHTHTHTHKHTVLPAL